MPFSQIIDRVADGHQFFGLSTCVVRNLTASVKISPPANIPFFHIYSFLLENSRLSAYASCPVRCSSDNLAPSPSPIFGSKKWSKFIYKRLAVTIAHPTDSIKGTPSPCISSGVTLPMILERHSESWWSSFLGHRFQQKNQACLVRILRCAYPQYHRCVSFLLVASKHGLWNRRTSPVAPFASYLARLATLEVGKPASNPQNARSHSRKHLVSYKLSN